MHVRCPNNATSVFHLSTIYEGGLGHGRLGYASRDGWVLFVIVGRPSPRSMEAGEIPVGAL